MGELGIELSEPLGGEPDAPGGPVVSSFAPSSGGPGTVVTIAGTGFTGATAVEFAGTAASFSAASDTVILAVVPADAVSGTIAVVGPLGTGTSLDSFTVTAVGVRSRRYIRVSP